MQFENEGRLMRVDRLFALQKTVHEVTRKATEIKIFFFTRRGRNGEVIASEFDGGTQRGE